MPRTTVCRDTLLVVAVALAAGSFSRALSWAAQYESRRASEYEVKAAYLYHFARYIEWPDGAFAGAEAPFIIGVLGDDPLGASLDKLANCKRIRGRRIVIRRFPSWREYRPCHILFVARATDARSGQEAIRGSRGHPLLIVGESDGFAAQGAAVNLFIDVDGSVGFELNLQALQRQNLLASARLLKLASVVEDSSEQ